MNSFAASTIAVVLALVVALIGPVVAATLFYESQATIGGNGVIVAFCFAALAAGTFTYRRLVR